MIAERGPDGEVSSARSLWFRRIAVDDDVLEVPVYVRAEWESEVKPGETMQGKKDAGAASGERVVKELGYWAVLGIGRIAG